MISLRDYQRDRMVAPVRKALVDGFRAPLLVAPTGSGKTRVFSFVAQQMTLRGKRIVVLVHRDELVQQVSDALTDLDVQHGFITAGTHYDRRYLAHVASVMTLVRRLERVAIPDGVITDEAHRAIAETSHGKCLAFWRKLNPKLWTLGVTATPERLSGEGLGEMFDTMILGPTVRELIDAGWLSPYRLFAPESAIDMSALHTRAGDFVRGEMDELMSKPQIIGNVVSHYARLCNGAPGIAFCPSVGHAEKTAERFRAAGFRALSIDGTMAKEIRRGIVADFRRGALNVLTSCDLVSEGFDCLDAETEILTSDGWSSIDCIDRLQDCYSLNLDTGRIELTAVIGAAARSATRGENVVSVRSQHMNIRVTEGHRIHYRTRQPYRDDGMSPDYRVATIKDLTERAQPFTIPISAEFDGFAGVPLTDDELRFIGWVHTDGYIAGTDISITQSKSPYVDEIEAMLRRIGFDYRKRTVSPKTGYPNAKPATEFSVCRGVRSGSMKRNGWDRLAPYVVKSVSPLLHNMTRAQFAVFWSALMDGNGGRQAGKSGTLTIARKDQADAYMQMAVLRGYAATSGTYVTRNGCRIYTLRARDAQFHAMAPKDWRGARFTIGPASEGERFWCVENRNGTIITRRGGRIAILGNCPGIHAAMLLRPTQSLALHMQQIGRSLRPAPGKDAAIILDHVGNSARHGLPDTEREWSLAGRGAGKKNGEPNNAVRQCLKCFAISAAAAVRCVACGELFPVQERKIDEVDGELSEIAVAHMKREAQIAQAMARDEPALIELAKMRGYRNPVYWARHVIAARRQRGRA